MKQFIYTNIGFEPRQYKMLKHIAVEEHKHLARLIREALDEWLRKAGKPKASAWENQGFFQIGHKWKVRSTRTPKTPNAADTDIYGL
jgi:hypothetical protein